MAHFARVENGIVQEVLVCDQDFIDLYADPNSGVEPDGPGTFVKCSYNTYGGVHYTPSETNEVYEPVPSTDQSKALRKNFPNIGWTYDADRDAFYDAQPYPSWTLNEDTCFWESPEPFPSDASTENRYVWNEDTTSWESDG